jgi:glycosyltransferase involved in cell wall biosynthesis
MLRMRVSLVIATYNWPEALRLVLLSVQNQSIIPYEVIIADDGSTNKTNDIINLFRSKLPIKHIWQEDNGFQKTLILNKAISRAKGDYIIQIDGDIIIHYDFIKEHIHHSRKRQFIHGSRVFLNKQISDQSIKKDKIQFSIFQKGIKNRFNGFNNNFLSLIFSQKKQDLKGARGCNFSFWKEDFIQVNGYNEEMVGWGKEDTELSVRMINSGVIKKQVKFNVNCYHLNHKTAKRDGLNINNNILSKAIKEKKTSCTKGIKQYEIRN